MGMHPWLWEVLDRLCASESEAQEAQQPLVVFSEKIDFLLDSANF